MLPIFILAGALILMLLVVFLPLPQHNKVAESDDSEKNRRLNEQEQIAYSYSCVYNSLVLFANSVDYLKSLSAPAFDPLFEIESEFDLGFSGYHLEKNFENGTIKENMKPDLLDFKRYVLEIPSELWNYEALESHEIWKKIRAQAGLLLDRMGETNREYNHDFTTIIGVNNK